MNDSFQIARSEARDPLVVALDVGSTATRCALFDSTGHPICGRVKASHSFTVGDDGTSEIDPDQVTAEVAHLLDEITDHPALAGRIRGVAMDTLASSMVAIDADNRALTPCYTYADSRNAEDAEQLRLELDEDEVQQRTGTRIHTSYLAPRLRWLARTRPDVFASATRFVSLGEYVQLQLLGRTAAGTPTAAWSGLLNRRTGEWDAELLAACGISADRLSPVQDPGIPLPRPSKAARKRWPALVGAGWFPSIGDGLGNNLGTGARDDKVMGCGASTSGALRLVVPGQPERLPEGLWCYRLDSKRSLVGGALTDVGRLFTWMVGGIASSVTSEELDEALRRDPEAGTPSVIPFLTGERSIGWAARARLVIANVTAAHNPADLVRGAAEGLAIGYLRVAEQLHELAPEVSRVVASGSVTARYPAFLQVLADVLQVPVEHVQIKRSTLLGAALVALETVAPDVERALPPVTATYEPRPGFADYYAGVRTRFEELYPVSVV